MTIKPRPIFVCYRRDDGIDTAQLLQLRLEQMFGDGSTFLDTLSLNPGEEYPIKLEEAVRGAKVLIVMIGQHWKGSDPNHNKLYDKNDWVRKELEICLNDPEKMILPVLIKNASFTEALKGLPGHLVRLARFNFIELHEKDFAGNLLPIETHLSALLGLANPLKDLPLDKSRFKFPMKGPFKGLEYFTEKDAKIFFGRGSEIRSVYQNVTNDNLLLLYGQSGVGKSSLLFAGLKPRMEFQGWTIDYIRKEKGMDFAQHVAAVVGSAKHFDKKLVILDQLEEVITGQSANASEMELIRLLTVIRESMERNCHLLLGFRKEYLPEFEKLLSGLEYNKIYLEPLRSKGVLEAIQGIVSDKEAHGYYELDFANTGLPSLIAASVLIDEESHVAPLLQMLLVKMYNEVATQKPRVFTKLLLDRVKSDSLNALILDQIDAIKLIMPDEVNNGLLLDLLNFFTTSRSTAASKTINELERHYGRLKFERIVAQLKDKYLLSDGAGETPGMIRLAHDALAPLVKELYALSALPGQKAARLLDSKQPEIIAGHKIELSRLDLNILDAGKDGMRSLSSAELAAIAENRQRIAEEEALKKSLEEQQQKEKLRLEIEKEELDSVTLNFQGEIRADILKSIAEGNCLLITGDRLLFDADENPLVNAVFQRATGVIGHAFVPDKNKNLIRITDSRDMKWFREALEREFEDEPLPANTVMEQLSALPFSCCLHFSFDVFLYRYFQQQQYPCHFSYYQDQLSPGLAPVIDWLKNSKLFSPKTDKPVLYNFFGSSENSWSIPLREEDMYKTIAAVQKNDFLPDHIRLLIERAKTILVIGVNWDAWYVQSLIRWIISDYRKYQQVYTFKDQIKLQHISFLRNMPVGLLDVPEAEFISILHREFSRQNMNRARIQPQ